MTHETLCPVARHDEAHWDWSYHCANDPECDEISCQCDLINLAYEQGWEAGYKQCDDEWMGKENYN